MAPPFPRPRRFGAAAMILLLGLAVSLLVWRYAARQEDERVHAEFLRRAQALDSLARERLLLYEEMIYSLRGAFLGEAEVSRAEFMRVADDLLHRHAGVQALEWVAVVPGDQRAAVEEKAARELRRPFVIRRVNAAGQFAPAPEAKEYTAILYIEPLAGNEAVLGYDLFSSPTAPAIARARQEGKLQVSGAFRLGQSTGPNDESGVVFILPVFGNSPSDRSVAGFVEGVFRVPTMLAQAHLIGANAGLLSYYLDLDTAPGVPDLLYANLAGREPLRENTAVTPPARDNPADFHDAITVGDRQWLLLIRMDPVWAASQRTHLPDLMLATGLAVTALLALFVLQLLQRTARVEHEVALRTTELRESEARLQAILDQDTAIIFLKDLAGRYIFVNQPYLNFFRQPLAGILHHTDHELFPSAVADGYVAQDRGILAQGRPVEFEDTAAAADGVHTSIVRKFPLRDRDGHIYALCGIATDITRFKRAEGEKLAMERQLLEGRRLESLGVLAGGIAHDFNNILTGVLGHASLARLQLAPEHEAAGTLAQIEHAARRAADLCAQLLAYAGKGTYVAHAIDLSALVRDTLALLEVSVAKGTRLDLALSQPLPAVQADATQLRQIIMNLVLNAGDAIGTKSGVIRIATLVRDLEAEFFRSAVRSPDLPAGRYVGLEVSDDGAGMTPDVIARIFDPFFTTKFSGRGLGLAAVLGIVQSHHGALLVDSRPGQGTTFRLFLPATDQTAVASNPPVDPSGGVAARLSGTVLVVDDEDAVRRVARLALTRLGARVLDAADGLEALRLVDENPGAIDLILLDLTMPGVSGEETLQRLRQHQHRHRVVIMSGYSESETAQRCLQLGAVEFLPKPFELGGLLAVVRAHLG